MHSVINGQSGTDTSPRRVNVESNVFFGIVVGKVEELSDENVGDLVVDVGAEEENAIFEETGDDVELGTGGAVNCGEGRRGARLLWGFFGLVGVVLCLLAFD